ncbi:JAB domain-containing protein [Raoultella ornithinolytica]|uniref:JAB domain-containing protein n=1 Tax=Raoultella ornithinolytica TaxID=54291 RepID=UPI001D0D1507|nr:JAB domain-containing protein [Raoultella ornithinolytica]
MVWELGIGVNAAAVIFAHNHPSGIPEPSHVDKAIRVRIKKGLAMVDVRALDHCTSAVSPRCPSSNGSCFDRRELRPPFFCDLCRVLPGSIFLTLWSTYCRRALLTFYI